MKVKIRVEQKHIRKGKKEMVLECPISLACQEAGIILPRVCGSYMNVGGENTPDYEETQHVVHLPTECGVFVNEFDRGHDVNPFEFEADVPDEYIEPKFRKAAETAPDIEQQPVAEAVKPKQKVKVNA